MQRAGTVSYTEKDQFMDVIMNKRQLYIENPDFIRHLELETEDSMFSWVILLWSLTGSQFQWTGVLLAPLDRIFRRRDTYSDEKCKWER